MYVVCGLKYSHFDETCSTEWYFFIWGTHSESGNGFGYEQIDTNRAMSPVRVGLFCEYTFTMTPRVHFDFTISGTYQLIPSYS